MSRVSTQITDGVAHVRLTRAAKKNAMDFAMAEAIVEAGHALIRAEDVRAVVLSGEGDAFCAGLDVMSFAQLAQPEMLAKFMERTHDDCNLMQEVAMVWRRMEVPVIAALHGVAFGAGFQLAMGADIRIAAPDTKLAIMEMKWGLIPDMGGMVLLPQLTRTDVIRRMTYSAKPFAATQCLDWGLVTELADDPVAAATEIATEIAGKGPNAMKAAKRLIGLAETEGREAVLLAESAEQKALIGQPEMMEIVAAHMEGRAPRFG